MIKKYVKKPVEIEAIQWNVSNFKEIKEFCFKSSGNLGAYFASLEEDKLAIRTLEGILFASNGDFIIKGIKGEFYPCKPDIFKLTYQEV